MLGHPERKWQPIIELGYDELLTTNADKSRSDKHRAAFYDRWLPDFNSFG